MNSTIQNTNLIYMAGYIDGDGCFSVGKYTDRKRNLVRYQHHITISSTNSNLLKDFHKEFGGCFRMIHERHIPEGHKQQYQFVLSANEQSSQFLEKVIPFLAEKKSQAEILYNFINTRCKETRNELIESMKKAKYNQNIAKEEHIDILKKDMLTIVPTESDYIYLAGFIDAECCLSINKSRSKHRENYHYKIYLSCNNTKIPSIQWIMQRFGGQIRFVQRKNINFIHRDQISWIISSKCLSKILPLVLPYLRYKKPVCEELIKMHSTIFINGGDRQTEEFHKSNSKIIEERERIFHKVQSLNKKGISHLSG